MIGLLVLVLVVPALVDMARRPTLRRFAFRNIDRRRGEAVLVIVGSLLGTAIITASFLVGDTIEASLRDEARTRLGSLDETVRIIDPHQASEVEARIGGQPIAGTDGTLRIHAAGAVVADTGAVRKAVPVASLIEVDFDQARRFGSDPAITGLADAGPNLRGDEAIIGEPLGRRIGVGVGDPIEVFVYGRSKRLTVSRVLPEIGLVGYVPVRSGTFVAGRPASVFVAAGTIEAMTPPVPLTAPPGGPAGATDVMAVPPSDEIAVSNVGGVFDGADGTEAVTATLTERTADLPGVQVAKVKGDVLQQAKAQGDSLTQLYGAVGFFSVVAGVLLLVNLFVMLAEERKNELGMLRAMGFKRNHLVRTFAVEGTVYSVIACVLGAGLGIAVGWVITRISSSIFGQAGTELAFPLKIKAGSLISGAAIGLVISMATVWGTSTRVARLNIIRAIRDLPEPAAARRGLRSLVLGLAGVAAGVVIFVRGWASNGADAVLAGPAIALFCLIPVLSRNLARRPVLVVLSGSVLVWEVLAFSVGGAHVAAAGIDAFVVQGVFLVGAAVAVLSQAGRVWTAIANGLAASGRGLATRLALAYPLARVFRTSLLIGMYAIVIFTMTFISVLAGIFANQAPQFTDEVRGGFDLFVDSNIGNPITTDELAAQPSVRTVAPLTRGLALTMTAARPEGTNVAVTGFDDRLLAYGGPQLESRQPVYGSDADAYLAVLGDPRLIIVNRNFGRRGGVGGPPQTEVGVGDVVAVKNPAGGATREATVVGLLSVDFVGNGAFVSNQFMTELLAPRVVQNRHYVKAEPGSDIEAVSTRINGALIRNGASANSFRSLVDLNTSQNLAVFSLLRGYLALGLLIGIAGLGVVMVRAVRERRRQIGMLRAMGFSSAIVRRAFLLEAGFIALQGILLGVVLGVITAYQLLVNSDAFGGQRLTFSWPWLALALISVIPLVASLLATAAPAGQASRVRPAIALRMAD